MTSAYRFESEIKRERWGLIEYVCKHVLVSLAAVGVCALILHYLGLDAHGASMALAVSYKFTDGKFGLSSGGLSGLNLTRGVWAGGTAYALGDTVQNGGFAYRASVAGISAASPGPSPNTLVDNTVTWVRIGAVSSVCTQDAAAAQELGYQAIVKDDTYGMGTVQYVKYTGTVVAGDWVIFDQQGKLCSQIPAAAPGASKYSNIGIAMGDGVNGTFGWVLIQGVHDQVNVTAGGTVGNLCAGVATVGRSTTVQTANFIFDGTVLRNAGVVGTGTVEIRWPSCSGR